MSTTAYIAVGSNLGDRRRTIEQAIEKLGASLGVRVLRRSALLENPAVGGPADSPAFLNGVVEIETTLDAHALLRRLLEIEQELGRDRRQRWEPRPIDLDLILFGDQEVQDDRLKVPHPRMHERRFVLAPLAEIAPEAVHPVLKKTARALLDGLSEGCKGSGKPGAT
jgi:2-amino-4-hydroxy-6-hydroxymethyldihydropteridine diphosphokinase